MDTLDNDDGGSGQEIAETEDLEVEFADSQLQAGVQMLLTQYQKYSVAVQDRTKKTAQMVEQHKSAFQQLVAQHEAEVYRMKEKQTQTEAFLDKTKRLSEERYQRQQLQFAAAWGKRRAAEANNEILRRTLTGWKAHVAQKKHEDQMTEALRAAEARRASTAAACKDTIETMQAVQAEEKQQWQVSTEQACRLLKLDYERGLAQVQAELRAERLKVQYEQENRLFKKEQMQQALMRGVCALNREAMGVFQEPSSVNESAPVHSEAPRSDQHKQPVSSSEPAVRKDDELETPSIQAPPTPVKTSRASRALAPARPTSVAQVLGNNKVLVKRHVGVLPTRGSARKATHTVTVGSRGPVSTIPVVRHRHVRP